MPIRRIICAPDSLKECLTASEAAAAMKRGILEVLPDAEVRLCPIADGGEGTVEAMLAATQGTAHEAEVVGPLGDRVNATWGMLGRLAGDVPTAVIEMAAASGLALVPRDRRDPTRTTTFGVGELIIQALGAGAQRIILGIGGSATTDGGCGCAQALGVVFRDKAGDAIASHLAGGALEAIADIDMSRLDPRIAQTRITVACDVTNPLTGSSGAAAIYGPQKGATPQQVQQLDHALAHLAELVRQTLGKDFENLPGAGAAGGLGFGLVAFAGAELTGGVQLVLEATNFRDRAAGCDLCLTAEGKLDGTSLAGKACLGVANAAKEKGVPTVALVGALGEDVQRTLEAGLAGYRQIGPGLSTDESIRRAAELMANAAGQVVRERFVD